MVRDIAGIVMAIAVALVVTTGAIAAQQAAPPPLSQKDTLQTPRTNVMVIVSGAELVAALEPALESPKQAGYSVSRADGSIVITGATMGKELTALVEKARVLMRDRPGKVEITQTGVSKNLAQIKEIYASGIGQIDALQNAYRWSPVVPFGTQMRLARPARLTLFDALPMLDGYAYAEQDREHALELERESVEIGRRYIAATDQAQRAQLESRLKTVLDELFDLKTKGYREKIKAIEMELKMLRTRVEERQKSKDLIVTGRFKELLGQENHLRW